MASRPLPAHNFAEFAFDRAPLPLSMTDGRLQGRWVRGYLCLAIAILGWGLTWPANKVLLEHFLPLTLLSLRSIIAALAFFVMVAANRQLSLPPRKDVPILVSIAFLHMIGFAVLAMYGLLLLSTGRSVVLAYTTPLWVLPAASIFLGERLTSQRLFGVALGLVGLMVLFNPAATNWRDTPSVLGNIALLVAAMLWAANILHIRAHRWQSTPLRLAPWEMLIAAAVISVAALIAEPRGPLSITRDDVLLLLFSGVFGTALPYWGVAVASRDLPAVATSLGLLCTPLVSLMTASLWLKEPLDGWLLSGAALVVLGIGVSILPTRHSPLPRP